MPSHPDRVRRNYIWTCEECFEQFKSKEELDKHLKKQTNIIDYGPNGPIISSMHWSGNSIKQQ